MTGIIELREEISHKMYNSHSYISNPNNEVIVTAGATKAIYSAITAFIDEGDIKPAYDCYEP